MNMCFLCFVVYGKVIERSGEDNSEVMGSKM